MRRLAADLAGIELVERHRELLERRSRRAGLFPGNGLGLLLDAAEEGDREAIQQLVCLLTTKFTGFFRHPHHFKLAVRHALGVARQRGRARLWCAGAATGEEAYSLAMALLETCHSEAPPASVLATDVDSQALATAERAEYTEAALRPLDPTRKARFFHQASRAGRWRLVPAVRQLVEFHTLNLAADAWPVAGPFDVIFCRNVLMYLNARHRHVVLQRMASLLAPGGLLILDPTEHPGQAGHLFTPGLDGVYSLRCASTAQNAGQSAARKVEV